MKFNKRTLTNPFILYSILFIIITCLCSVPFIKLRIVPIWNADAVGQYYPAFLYIGSYIRTLLYNLAHGSFSVPVFDLKIGMGENIIGCLNYYGFGDPINILAIFATNHNGYIIYSIVFLLRVYLAGISALIYSKEMNFDSKASVIGAVAYSFCGFSIYGGLMYIEWLAVLFYFPLMMTGAEMIIKGNKRKAPLFVFSIMYGALCGFYYLYMSSLILAVYCILRLLFKKHKSLLKDSLKKIGILLALYLIGIILASPFLLPSINTFLNSERNGSIVSIITDHTLYIPKFHMIRDFFICSIKVTDTYAMGIGIAEWLLIAISIFMPNSSKNLQLKISILLTSIAISMPITYWLFNGFGESNSRWYYIVHFLLMVVFVSTLSDLLRLTDQIKYKRKLLAQLCACLIALLTCINVVRNTWELIMPSGLNWGEEFIDIDDISKYVDSPVTHSDTIMNDNDLFRVDTDTFLVSIGRPENVAMINNYNGCTYWFSMINKYTQEYSAQNLGFELPWRSFGFSGNVYTEAMSGCKYYVSNNSNLTGTYDYVESVTFDGNEWYVYVNPYYAGFAYMLSERCDDYNDSFNGSLEDYNCMTLQKVIEGSINDISYNYNNNCFKCTTTAAGCLIVTIPYDKHWKAYIDGKIVDIKKFNAFLSIDISDGEHEIKLVY